MVADVENVQTGERQRITSRYLLGIDGASSTVRRALGFAMIGEDGSTQRAFMGGTMLSFFIRSPTLMAASKRPPTNMTWILNREMRGMSKFSSRSALNRCSFSAAGRCSPRILSVWFAKLSMKATGSAETAACDAFRASTIMPRARTAS